MRDEIWILGFTVFGHHWRGIKIYERCIRFDKSSQDTEAMFTKRANNLEAAIESERSSVKLELKAV